MEMNEIVAWFFIVFGFASYIFRDANRFFAGCWFVYKCFFIALFAVLAIGFVKDQFKNK